MYGYCGRILYVDLTSGKMEERELTPEMAQEYMGGVSLASRLLFDMKGYEADPLGPENPIIFMTGPLAGTPMPGSSRVQVAARSPLTGGFGSSSCGGYFGPYMKYAGYDGIVITGASQEPVYLFINSGEPSIVAAGTVWGKPTSQVSSLIAEEQGVKRVHSMSIGPAGENKVLYACIMDTPHNAAGRTGLGAVMGAKKLKAVAVHGKDRPALFDKSEFTALREKISKVLKDDVTMSAYKRFGTAGTMQLGMLVGDVPTKNWRVGDWSDGADRINGITMADTIMEKTTGCFGCPIGCKRVVTIPDGKYKMEKAPGPEYETVASMGAMNLIDDLEALCAANVICNDMGMDTISAGSSIAFLTEAYEKGLITKEETGGLELDWGRPDTLLELLEKTARREGPGDMLAEGVKRMSEKIGGGADEFAIHSRGMEAPMHDPRAYHGLALAYTTAPRGACHISHNDLVVEMGVYKYPEFGLDGEYPPLTKDGKAEMVARSEDQGFFISSINMCMFVAWPMSIRDHILPALKHVTGFEWTVQDINAIGERTWFIQRAFNNLCGFSADDDTVPSRILKPHEEGTPSGLDAIVYNTTKFKPPELPFIRDVSISMMNRIVPHQKKVFQTMGRFMPTKKLNKQKMEKKLTPDHEHMIREYYTVREIDREGRPRPAKLKKLKLDYVADALYPEDSTAKNA